MSVIDQFINNTVTLPELRPMVKTYLEQYCDVTSPTLILNSHIEIIGQFDDIRIPIDLRKTYDMYPIEEWSHTITYNDHQIKIIFGLDWFGIRYAKDLYCNYIEIHED